MTREALLSVSLLLSVCAQLVQAQNAAVEAGSQKELKLLNRGRTQVDAGLSKPAAERRKRAKAIPPKDRLMINTIIEKLAADGSSTKYHFDESLESAGVGSVIRLRPFTYKDANGVMKTEATTVKLVSIKNKSSAIVEYQPPPRKGINEVQRFLLQGVDTNTFSGSKSIPLDGFYVVGEPTKLTITKGNSQTVFPLKSIDVKPYEEERKRNAEEKAAQSKSAALAKREASFRKWTSSSGNYSVDALLVNCASGAITLEKRDGTKVTVELTKLSEADQAYANTWLQKH